MTASLIRLVGKKAVYKAALFRVEIIKKSSENELSALLIYRKKSRKRYAEITIPAVRTVRVISAEPLPVINSSASIAENPINCHIGSKQCPKTARLGLLVERVERSLMPKNERSSFPRTFPLAHGKTITPRQYIGARFVISENIVVRETTAAVFSTSWFSYNVISPLLT